MLRKYLIAGTVALATLSTAAPSIAQSIEFGRDGIKVQENKRDRRPVAVDEITERQAIRIAKSEGVREVEDVSRTRLAFRVDGVDRRGDDISVNVDRVSGEVLSVD